jgi:hypothetical protein
MDHRSDMATSTQSNGQPNIQPNIQLGYDPANYYVWQAPDGFSVHLSLSVVRELSAQIATAGEIRGVLLGRSITAPFAATMAEDFVVIPPSEDFEAARRAAEHDGRELRVIGYFRSQREGRLRLDARDLRTFDRLFYQDGNIGLLIRIPRRGHGEAALFYWHDGQPQPREFGFGFPFDETKLAGGHPGWRFPDPLEPGEEAPPRPAFQRTPQAPAVTPGEGIRWSRLWLTAALVVTAIVVMQVAWNSRGIASANSAPAADAAPLATTSADQAPLGLKVNSQPHQLEIRWNRAASVVAGAVKGTMSISEAGVTEAVPFDPRELREGYVAYTPKTNDVSIRLEVTAADGAATTESIRVVAIP